MPEFEKLLVWRRGHQLALMAYDPVKDLPDCEQ